MNNKVIPFLLGFALAFSSRFIFHVIYWIMIAGAFSAGLLIHHI